MSSNWWKEAVVYQIYPSSFRDASGDGWGDLQGIISKIEYLHKLSVDIVWISPVYKSPQIDMGYDIADYKLIDPVYGSNEDIDTIVSELKKRGMKLWMDLVVNHTSSEHEWFKASRSSKENPKRDWYIWKDPSGIDEQGNPLPPNNWSQILGDANSAWTFDSTSGQFYLGLFTPSQPDLNWENEHVRAAVHDVMRFWLNKGVTGFRMDVINLISKDQRFPDADSDSAAMHDLENNKESQPKFRPGSKWYVNGPRLHEYLRELKREVLTPYNAITVGEMPGVSDANEILKTVNQKDGELNMIFIFDVVDIDNIPKQPRLTYKPWEVKDFVEPISKWQSVMTQRNGWNSVFIENHDNPRSVSRYCNDSDEMRDRGAKLLALMQTTLSGTLFVFQGEELGIRNMPKSWPIEEFKDVESINFWKKSIKLHDGDKKALERARFVLDTKARDHARTPMHWDATENAGFCAAGVKPWMRVMDDYKSYNVEMQMSHDSPTELSNWQFWQRGLVNRKKNAEVFVHGSYTTIDDAANGSVFAYARTSAAGQSWLVVLNFSDTKAAWQHQGKVKIHDWVAGTLFKDKPDQPIEGTIPLQPWEGLLGRCEIS